MNKNDKITELLSQISDLEKSDEITAKEISGKKNEIFELLLDAPNPYREEIFKEMPGNKREDRKAFKKYRETVREEGNTEEKKPEDRYDKETIKEAEKLLSEGNILQKIKTVLDFKIAGEDLNKLGIFLQLLTKDTDKPLMIFGLGKQGEGKSYIAKSVISLFPDHQVEKLTDATVSSIYRTAQNEGKDYFDGKIVYFGEVPEEEGRREVFQIFRQLVSEGEVNKRLTMDTGNGHESIKLELEGNPALITTTVDGDLIDKQDLSRGIVYTPSTSKEQNQITREFQNTESELPEEVRIPEDIRRLEQTIKCALDILSEDNVEMVNPFARIIDWEIPLESDNIKRDYPKILNISTKMPAYLYHRQRGKATIGNSKITLVNYEDIIRGMAVSKEFVNNMLEGRSDSVVNAFNTISENVSSLNLSHKVVRNMDSDKLPDDTAFTNEDLRNWMGAPKQTVRSHTRELSSMEVLYKDRSSKPHEHYLLQNELSETEGITLKTIHNIIASSYNEKKLDNWAKQFINKTNYDGSVSDLREKILFTQEDTPIITEIGLERDHSHTTPHYLQNTTFSTKGAKAMEVDITDSKIISKLPSVNESFSSKLSKSAQPAIPPEKARELEKELQAFKNT